MTIAIIISLAVLCCTLTVLFCRRYVKKAYSSVDSVLDNVLAKGSIPAVSMEADSRLSKLTHKAAKIAQLNTASLSQTLREKGTIQSFLSDMSHQMKTPLSGIAMYTDLLIEGNLTPEEQQEFLTRTKLSVDKLQWMMDSLVKMSSLEVGAIELSPIPASIKQTLSESIGMVFASATKKNMTILTADFKDTELLHDKKWTVEAMTNILENAVKYGASDSEIRIEIETMPLYTKISFTNFGAGIDRTEWNSIFKRFYRGKNAKDESGAGLGLYLAALILEKQGGYILVDSKSGEHTTFSMFLQNCKNKS